MNNRAVMLSLIMACFAYLFLSSYVSDVRKEASARYGEFVTVYVAKGPIGEMQSIDNTMIKTKAIPKRFKEPSAITIEKNSSKEESDEILKSMLGAIAVVPIGEEEQITYNKINQPGIRTGLSPQVTPGKRAVAVPVDEVSGVAKLVKPGDRVDVIAVIEAGDSKKIRISKTVLEDALVLAVGRIVTNNAQRKLEARGKQIDIKSLTSFDRFSSATLEVNPYDVQKISLLIADPGTRVFLSLRNNDDEGVSRPKAVVMEDVLGQDVDRIPAATPRRGGNTK